MKKQNTELGLSIVFVFLTIICRGLASYFFESKTLASSLKDVTIMAGNILLIVVGVGAVTIFVILIYRKK